MQLPGPLLSPSSKNKKIQPEKKILMIREKELSSSSIKEFIRFSYISGNRNPQKFFILQETETLKSFLYFGKWNF